MPAILFAIFIDLTGFGIIVPILPFLVIEYGGSAASGTALLSIYSLFAFAAGPIWGRLSDRIGRRPALAATFLGATASYIVLACADSLAMLFLARALSGAMAGNVGIAMAAIADLTDENNRGRAMGLIGGVFGLGFAFGPVIGGLLSGMSEQSPVFVPGLAAAGLSLTAMLLTLKFMPETHTLEAPSESDTPVAKVSWTSFLSTPAQIALFSMFIVTSAGQSLTFAVLPFWSMGVLGWSQIQVGYLMGAIGLCIAAIQSLATGPLFKSLGELWSLALGIGVFLIGCLVVVLATASPGSTILSFPLMMAGLTLSFPALNSLLSRRTDRRHQGAALGLSNGISALGRMMGPIAGGFMFEQVSPTSPFYITASLGLFALFWCFWEIRNSKR
ncbi:MAG: MFS transporter [Alphaproteobacteria bacterium]|nr:MFS transporter [Alphaproteobacteria bacterium]